MYIRVIGSAVFVDAAMGDIMSNRLIPARVPSLTFPLALMVLRSRCTPPPVLFLRRYLELALEKLSSALLLLCLSGLLARVVLIASMLCWSGACFR
jgi:hypothetical protein